MALVRVKDRFQVTLPTGLRQKAGLEAAKSAVRALRRAAR